MPSVINQQISVSRLAGRPAPQELLMDVRLLESEYDSRRPESDGRNHLLSFGTGGSVGLYFEIDARSFKHDAHPTAIVDEGRPMLNKSLGS